MSLRKSVIVTVVLLIISVGLVGTVAGQSVQSDVSHQDTINSSEVGDYNFTSFDVYDEVVVTINGKQTTNTVTRSGTSSGLSNNSTLVIDGNVGTGTHTLNISNPSDGTNITEFNATIAGTTYDIGYLGDGNSTSVDVTLPEDTSEITWEQNSSGATWDWNITYDEVSVSEGIVRVNNQSANSTQVFQELYNGNTQSSVTLTNVSYSNDPTGTQSLLDANVTTGVNEVEFLAEYENGTSVVGDDAPTPQVDVEIEFHNATDNIEDVGSHYYLESDFTYDAVYNYTRDNLIVLTENNYRGISGDITENGVTTTQNEFGNIDLGTVDTLEIDASLTKYDPTKWTVEDRTNLNNSMNTVVSPRNNASNLTLPLDRYQGSFFYHSNYSNYTFSMEDGSREMIFGGNLTSSSSYSIEQMLDTVINFKSWDGVDISRSNWMDGYGYDISTNEAPVDILRESKRNATLGPNVAFFHMGNVNISNDTNNDISWAGKEGTETSDISIEGFEPNRELLVIDNENRETLEQKQADDTGDVLLTLPNSIHNATLKEGIYKSTNNFIVKDVLIEDTLTSGENATYEIEIENLQNQSIDLNVTSPDDWLPIDSLTVSNGTSTNYSIKVESSDLSVGENSGVVYIEGEEDDVRVDLNIDVTQDDIGGTTSITLPLIGEVSLVQIFAPLLIIVSLIAVSWLVIKRRRIEESDVE